AKKMGDFYYILKNNKKCVIGGKNIRFDDLEEAENYILFNQNALKCGKESIITITKGRD
ncbi:hypothetical protein LCGC14_2794190, partial [marine sediment metagenome]